MLRESGLVHSSQPPGQCPLLMARLRTPKPTPHAFMWDGPEEGEGKGHGNVGPALTMEL